MSRRSLGLLALILPLLALFVFVLMRTGPLASVAVLAVTVETQALSPAMFGTGTVEARYALKLGPTAAGRLKQLSVQVGESVKAGQVLGEMEADELNLRVQAQDAFTKRAQAAVQEVQARQEFAHSQAQRYAELAAKHMVSAEVAAAKQQELRIADAALAGAQEEVRRGHAERAGVQTQRGNLRLIAPFDALVVARHVEPGATLVAGQAVVELVDPRSLWVKVRFDQHSSANLAAGLSASIVLRSRAGQALPGRVLQVEPLADAITEETLARIVFDTQPARLPPIGELAEVTVAAAALPAGPVIPNAALVRGGGKLGVWKIVDGALQFAAVETGVSDLNGLVQIRQGLRPGEQVVLYSEKTLSARSRVHLAPQLAGR